MTDDKRGPGEGDAQTSRLSELLECERELAALDTAAREEAHRRIAQARDEAARAAADLEASLEDDAERIRRKIREESQTRIRDISARARELVEGFEGLSDERVEQLAESAFRRLLGTEEPA